MNAAGLKQTMNEAITQGDKDFSALISKMKEEGIDVIYYPGYATEAGLIVRQARDQGLKAQFIGFSGLLTEAYWRITGPAGEGTLMPSQPDPARSLRGLSSTNSGPKASIPKASRSTPTPRSRPSRKRPKRPNRSNSTICQKRCAR